MFGTGKRLKRVEAWICLTEMEKAGVKPTFICMVPPYGGTLFYCHQIVPQRGKGYRVERFTQRFVYLGGHSDIVVDIEDFFACFKHVNMADFAAKKKPKKKKRS
jgi:hypothetical protein